PLTGHRNRPLPDGVAATGDGDAGEAEGWTSGERGSAAAMAGVGFGLAIVGGTGGFATATRVAPAGRASL
ncbi:hypothetical protein, partial [Enterococcus faecium]